MSDSPTLGRTDPRAWTEEQESPVVPTQLGEGAGARRRGAGAHDGAAPMQHAPSSPTQSHLARRTRSPPPHDSTLALSPPPPAHAPSTRMGANANVGLGLGLPVELDELLEAGEAFAGLGAGAIQRTLSASTASSTSHSSSSHPGSPRSGARASLGGGAGGGGGAGNRARGARWSASTAATSVHGAGIDEDVEGEGLEKARSPADSMPRTPSLAGSSSAGENRALLGLAPSPAAAHGSFPFPASSGTPNSSGRRSSSARRPSTSSATTTSPHPSSPSSRSSALSHTAHPSSSPSPPPPAAHWHAPWAPPAGLDDEEQLVLGLLPILHPGAGLLEPERAHDIDDARREGALSAPSERGSAVELERKLAHGPPPADKPAPAHPFSAPGVALRHSPSPPASTSTSRTTSLLVPEPAPSRRTKRTSMLSTLAAPFAGLSRGRSTGSSTSGAGAGLGVPGEGERARAYRLSVIGEAPSSSHSLLHSGRSSASSSSTSSLVQASSSSWRRQLRRMSISSSARATGSSQSRSAGGIETALTETSTGSQVRYVSAEAAREELEGMNGKAARLLGLSVAVPAAGRGEEGEEDRAVGRSRVAAVERSGSVRSSMSRGGEQEVRTLPRWPARRDEVEPFELSSADMYKLGAPSTSRFRSGARTPFRPRFVVLSASTPPPSTSFPPSYHLHSFTSRHPSERETRCLHLSSSSIVCVPSAAELPSRPKDGRAFAIKVTGRQEPTGDERTTQAQANDDSAWVLGLDDEGVFCEWLGRLKDVVRELREEAAPRRALKGRAQQEVTPFDLDIARRAADDGASLASGESGLGSLVLSAQGWQLEPSPRDVDARSRRPSVCPSATASSSWPIGMQTTRSQPGDDGASSRSGRQSLDDCCSAPYVAPAPSAAAGSSFLDADSSGDDSFVDDDPPSASRRTLALDERGKRSTHAPESTSAVARGAVQAHAHLAPPRPPPSSALPPLPSLPLEHDATLSPSHLDSYRRPFHTSTTSRPAFRHGRPERLSYLSLHSSDSLPPPMPPPRSKLPALPPVPPSPDLAQLERELRRRAPSRTRSECGG
ncbi:hypothetical protein JCM9279_003580 [Rhodotorula babjevae]